MDGIFLRYHYDKMESVLGEDLKFQLHLKKCGIVPSDIPSPSKDFQTLFNEYIVKSQISTIVDILYEMNKSKYETLANDMTNTWNSLIDDCKKQVRNKLAKIQKFAFFKANSAYVKFEEISTSIQLASYNLSLGDSNDLFYDEREFLETINKGCSERILICGDAGIGKTFHSLKLLYLWACKNELLQDYLVLYVNLGDIQSNDSFESVLFNTNFSKDSPITKQLLAYYLSEQCKDKKRRILLLLDGADELKFKNSYFNSIINGDKRLKVDFSVIVWSRKWRIKSIMHTFDSCFEIKGFSTVQLLEFFQNYFNETNIDNTSKATSKQTEENDDSARTTNYKSNRKSKILWNFLNVEKKHIIELCKNPLFACLTAGIWDEKQNKIHNNESSIYKEAVEVLFSIKGLSINHPNYKKFYDQCSKLAFENLLFNTPIVINDIQLDSELFAGIIIPLDERQENKEEINKYKFIHFLFQEYFTAQYIIEQFNNEMNDNNDYSNNSISMIIRDFKNLFLLKNVLIFIREINDRIFSEIAKIRDDTFLVLESEEIYKLIRCRPNVINLKNISLSTVTWKTIIYIYNANITDINFKYVKFQFQQLLNLCSEHLKNSLKVLKIQYVADEEEEDLCTIENTIENLLKLEILHLKDVPFKKSINSPIELVSVLLIDFQMNNCNIRCFGNDKINFTCPNIKRIDLTRNDFNGKFN
ncbi:unnamed protein product [Dimorphilus gyrociliatus]|uniref:NACHT domain-containing protein n=1 Tax=Dimorphilus gyrociliatus TaxID=2664684 RepID=A0A7I8WE21_9ANNE|nr:unnamed protein product [Dimorphilus gyrociliatus]